MKKQITFEQLKKLVKEGSAPATPTVDYETFKEFFVDRVYSDGLLEVNSLNVLREKAGMGNDWHTYSDHHENLFVLNVKYKGQGDWDKFNKDGRADKLNISQEDYWEMLQVHIKDFYDGWDAAFQEKYKHTLYAAGRSGGYWGIDTDFVKSEDRDFIIPDDATLKPLYEKALKNVEFDPETSSDDWVYDLVDTAIVLGGGPDGWPEPELIAQHFQFNPEFVGFCKKFERDLLQRSNVYATQEFNDEEFENMKDGLGVDDELEVTEGGFDIFDMPVFGKRSEINNACSAMKDYVSK